jgi:hypothetical protein
MQESVLLFPASPVPESEGLPAKPAFDPPLAAASSSAALNLAPPHANPVTIATPHAALDRGTRPPLSHRNRLSSVRTA